jgi:hypothetical protein
VRKYLALVLGTIFILSFAALASAQDGPEVTLGGKIMVKGWHLSNVSLADDSSFAYVPTKEDAQNFYYTHLSLSADAKASENVRGMVELEIAHDGSGQSGLAYWGTYDSKYEDPLLVRQAWIQYTGAGLGMPAGIKVGHMPYALGLEKFLNLNRFGSDGILVWLDPMKELNIALSTWKIVEGELGGLGSFSDDVDAYIADLNYAWDADNTVGANITYLTHGGTSDEELDFYNAGINAHGKISGVSYGLEADLQFGEEGSSDFAGYGLYAKLGYMVDPINIRISGAYGSGDDDNDSDIDEFLTLEGPDYGYTARLVHYTLIYERILKTAAHTGEDDVQSNTGISNTTYVNLGVDVTPMPDLSLALDGFYLMATETPSGVDDYIGTEIDLKATYKLAKNLNYCVEAGYFMPGDFYKDSGLVSDDKEVLSLAHSLTLTF